MVDRHDEFMKIAIDQARTGMTNGEGGPFGAIVVKDGKIIGRGNNQVLLSKDPTAHAEVVAIRDACRHLGHFQLDGCILYTSCEPCPMCLGAIYWARPDAFYYGANKSDAAKIGFDDDFIYQELPNHPDQRSIKGIQIGREDAVQVFQMWSEKEDKTLY